MSTINIPGVSSKYNTTQIVNDLVAAEKIKLTRMEDDVKELETERSTWRQINQDLGNLQRAVKALYGFESPFSEKIVNSSNENLLTATANRSAIFDSHSVTIKQIATSDRFFSPQLDRKIRVDGGHYTFTVGDKIVDLKYRGGTLEDFVKRINEKGKGLINASVIRDTPRTHVLLLEAIPTGSKNRLTFLNDAKDFVIKMGMMRELPDESGKVSLNNVTTHPITASGTPAPSNSITISEESIVIHPSSSMTIPFDNRVKIEEGLVLEYTYRTIEYSDSESIPIKPPGPLWTEVPKGSYKGIDVRSAPNTIDLPTIKGNEPPPRVDENNILSIVGSTDRRNLPPITPSADYRQIRVPSNALPNDVQALVVDNTNTHKSIEIKDIRVYNPNVSGGMEPINPADIARDAIVNYRGIDIQRSTNNIDDLIDGVTLNLKRTSPDPIEINVAPDTDTVKNSIFRFIFSYNNLFTRILVLTENNTDVIDELEYLDDDQRDEYSEQLGRLRGDFSLGQIKGRLQTITSSAYPTEIDPNLAILSQIGISTNAAGQTGGNLNRSKLRGYLEVDEELLDEKLASDMPAVKELFGRDTSGDLLIDNGVAKRIDEYLSPFTQTGGFTSIRIARIDGQISDVNGDIDDYKEYLDEYETDLKRQYGSMEGMLNQLENSSRDLENFNRQFNNYNNN